MAEEMPGILITGHMVILIGAKGPDILVLAILAAVEETSGPL